MKIVVNNVIAHSIGKKDGHQQTTFSQKLPYGKIDDFLTFINTESSRQTWINVIVIALAVGSFTRLKILCSNLTSIAEGEFNEERSFLGGGFLWHSLFGACLALLVGLLADCVSRKLLIIVIVSGGSLATFFTARCFNIIAYLLCDWPLDSLPIQSPL